MYDLMTYHDGVISVWCSKCGHCEEIPGTPELYDRIRDRSEAIQDILPGVSPGTREMFISGQCDICFKLSTSYLDTDQLDTILAKAVRLGLLTEDEKGKVISASVLYLDNCQFLIDMLTELEWHDGSDGDIDLRPQLREFRQKILEVREKAMAEE